MRCAFAAEWYFPGGCTTGATHWKESALLYDSRFCLLDVHQISRPLTNGVQRCRKVSEKKPLEIPQGKGKTLGDIVHIEDQVRTTLD
jgi:hypothetical protein